MQLEYSESASRFNLLENGDFKYSSMEDVCWTLDDSATFSYGSSHPVLDSNRLLMLGESSSSQYAEQTINVSGENGDEIIIAGWALGDSIHTDSSIYNFRITVQFFKNGESVNNTIYNLYFNENNASSVWQYNAAEITAPSSFDAITVRINSSYNTNAVFFDGIQLYMERIGTSYTYNSAGKVTESVDILDLKTTYSYEQSCEYV